MGSYEDPSVALASVAAVCLTWGLASHRPVVTRLEAFLDYSVHFSIQQAIQLSSLRLVQRVMIRSGMTRYYLVEGLYWAAQAGNLDIIAWLSEMGQKVAKLQPTSFVNYPNSAKSTALLAAAEAGHLSVVKWLLDQGARCTAHDREGQTAVLLAAEKGHLHVVQCLVESGSSLNETTRSGRSLLHLAAGNGHIFVVKWLVESSGARGNAKDRCSKTPIHLAAENGHLSVVQFLVDHLTHGRDLDAGDHENRTALHFAAGKGHLDVVRCLVGQGASVNAVGHQNQTALQFAASRGHLRVVQWLADHGAAVTDKFLDTIFSRYGSTQDGGQTALNDAAMNGYLPVAQFLVRHGLDPCRLNTSGRSSLYYAIVGCHSQVVMFFLTRNGTSKKWNQAELWLALFSAVKRDEDGIVQLLYDKYWDLICQSDAHGRTVLHKAAAEGEVKALAFLLSHGVDADQADLFGVTPCIEACRHQQLQVLRCLLSARASPKRVNLAGRTALHCAAETGFVDAVDVLLSFGADANARDRCGWTPLHCAAAAGQLRLVEDLASRGIVAKNSETLSGKTALVLSVERGHSEVAAFLMKQRESSDAVPAPASTSLASYKEYVLDSSEVHFTGTSEGLWLDSPIEVKAKRGNESTNFVEELDRWSKLNHPHLVRLYGVYYSSDASDPVFIYERATNGSLLEYLTASRQELLWDKLYEAALGLQYLHDRNIVHGELSCDSIVVAASGVAKLRNLGRENTTADYRLPWTAPELLSGFPTSFASDVYAFGMTILEAVRSKPGLRCRPWGIFNSKAELYNLPRSIVSGESPDKPMALSEMQWRMIERMCSYDPRDRITAADVVRELEVFTHDYKKDHADDFEEESTPTSWAELGNVRVDVSSFQTVSTVLEEIKQQCDRCHSSTMDVMNRDVYDRFADIFTQLHARHDPLSRDLSQRFTDILNFFYKRMKNMSAVGSARAAHFAMSRQGANNSFSVHCDLDAFMAMAQLSSASQVHQWRGQWDRRRKKQQHDMLEKLENLPELLGDLKDVKQREAALAYLRFELSKYPTSYAASRAPEFTRAKSTISSLVTKKNASWFIPAYEVEFDKFDEFSRGAFGKVYLGRWKRSRVVVKKVKLGSREHEAAFLNEVEIWHQLYHPHVVQLFGACHIGQPFFVCEYAGGGQLDVYVRAHPDKVWEKLYEAALGLRYLHMKRVVHGDLKCNNILIATDGRAQLTDFGLSTLQTSTEVNEPESEEQSDDKPKVGAIRWKAPEVLRGDKATFASDIYSFGMCVLEAVSGKFPWGYTMDPVVKYYVLEKRKIPMQPENCSDDVYRLVERMSCFEPSERLKIREVIDELKLLVPRSTLR